jgi:Mg-chelatase subunit ChlD
MFSLVYDYGWLVWLAAVVISLLSYGNYRRKRLITARYRTVDPFFKGVHQEFNKLTGKGGEYLKILLLASVVVVGGFALLGPRMVWEQSYKEKRGAYVVNAADITYSMQAKAAEDSEMTRMEVMQEVISDLLSFLEQQKTRARQDNRILLLAFGWDAWLLNFYPTNDFQFLRRQLDDNINLYTSLEYGREGSNMAAALLKSVLVFPDPEPGELPRKNIVLAFTDGEPYGDLNEIQKKTAQLLAAYAGLAEISFYFVSIGDPEKEFPLPKFDVYGNIIGEVVDEKGVPVKTVTNPVYLEYLAQKTGGQLIDVSDSALLKRRLRDEISQAQETGEIKKERIEYDLTVYFLLVFCLLLTLYFLKFKE